MVLEALETHAPIYDSPYQFPWDSDRLIFMPPHIHLMKEQHAYPRSIAKELMIMGEDALGDSWTEIPVFAYWPYELHQEEQQKTFLAAVNHELRQLPYSYILQGLKTAKTQEVQQKYLNEWYLYFIRHHAAHHLIDALCTSGEYPEHLRPAQDLQRSVANVYNGRYTVSAFAETIEKRFTDLQ